mgnify:CR=1 FL=1
MTESTKTLAPQPSIASYTSSSPYDSASLLSHITFSYILPLLRLNGRFSPADLPLLPLRDSPKTLFASLTASYNARRSRTPSSTPTTRVNLWVAIYDSYKPTFYATLFWVILEHATKILQPLLLSELLAWIVENAARPTSEVELKSGVLLSIYMLIASYLQALFHHQLYYLTMRTGWNLRTTLTAMIHHKLLKLSSASLNSGSGQQAINLISTDVFRFDNFAPFLWYYLTGPVDFAIVLYLLSLRVTILPALIGSFVLILQVIFQLKFGKTIGRLRRNTAKKTDQRLNNLKECVGGIETVK